MRGPSGSTRRLLARHLIVGLGELLADARWARIEPLLHPVVDTSGSPPPARHRPMSTSRRDVIAPRQGLARGGAMVLKVGGEDPVERTGRSRHRPQRPLLTARSPVAAPIPHHSDHPPVPKSRSERNRAAGGGRSCPGPVTEPRTYSHQQCHPQLRGAPGALGPHHTPLRSVHPAVVRSGSVGELAQAGFADLAEHVGPGGRPAEFGTGVCRRRPRPTARHRIARAADTIS